MGNVNSLFTTNPSEILTVDAYLSDLSCDSIENLGSTRFMKVAKGRTSEGVFVYKVYVRQDNASLDPYPSLIIDIRKSLARAPNCCPVKKVLVKPKYAVMLRSYQKHTLFDRLSTRPFVVYPEKIWYIFLLFKALSQCEAANVCHGDLKSQNVLISSSNWLQITDFAPFKPKYLSRENPSSFTFFFDTSRRQSCYIAPERFLSSSDYEKINNEGSNDIFGKLEPSMDVFSAGCIVYELLNDGKPAFTYGELCEYSTMSNSDAANVLDRLQKDVPAQFRPLLKLLLNREPTLRLSANAVLSGAAFSFPVILESFLFHYLDVFRPLFGSCGTAKEDSVDDFSQSLEMAYVEPDDVIAKLKREKTTWWSQLTSSDDNKQFVVLFVSLVTSNMRALRTIQAKTDAMKLLVDMSTICESSIAIDRMLPYFVHYMNDPESQVRASAITLSAKILETVTPKTYEESLTFVDYLFPELISLQTDSCAQNVTFAIAKVLGSLAVSAYRFLIAGRDIRAANYDDELSISDNNQTDATHLPQSFNDDSAALYNCVSTIVTWLCLSEPMVKLCMLEATSLRQLNDFYMKMKASDSLIKLLITFINVKTEWRLRAAFFDVLPICLQKETRGKVALIQQGLQDFEENIVIKTLGCLYVLIRNDILDRKEVMDLLVNVLPFLVHPNEWMRLLVCEILCALDKKWHMADIHVKILPKVRPFVVESKKKLLSLKSKMVLFNSLIEPIPRDIWCRIVEMSLDDTRQLEQLLEAHFNNNAPFDSNAQWFTRIFARTEAGIIARHDARRSSISEERNLKMSLESKDRLLKAMFAFRKMLVEMANTRNTAGMESMLTRHVGMIDLSSNANSSVQRKKFSYKRNASSNSRKLDRKDTIFADSEVPYEEERTVTGNGTANLRSLVYQTQLNATLSHLNELHSRNISNKSIDSSASLPAQRSGKFSIGGTIITHLHEHSDRITKLAASNDLELFASSSVDGTVKIWKKSSVLGQGYGAARSEDTWTPADGAHEKVRSVGWCDSLICAASQDGYVRWADVSRGAAKVQTKVQVPDNDGFPLEVHTSGDMCVLRTHHGVLYGLDLRVGSTNGPLGRHDVWRKKIKDARGLITCSTIDPWQRSWMVLGAVDGSMLLYDLRFREEVHSWKSPDPMLRPVGIWANTMSRIENPEIYVAFNLHGDVSAMDISAQPMRKQVFWTGGPDILNYSKESQQYYPDLSSMETRALCVCSDTGHVYTGDTKGTLRKWNPLKATGCEVLSVAPRGRQSSRAIFEETIDPATKVSVIRERRIPDTEAQESRRIVPMETRPTTHHRTPITDLIMLSSDILVSAGSDGIIKIWK